MAVRRVEEDCVHSTACPIVTTYHSTDTDTHTHTHTHKVRHKVRHELCVYIYNGMPCRDDVPEHYHEPNEGRPQQLPSCRFHERPQDKRGRPVRFAAVVVEKQRADHHDLADDGERASRDGQAVERV